MYLGVGVGSQYNQCIHNHFKLEKTVEVDGTKSPVLNNSIRNGLVHRETISDFGVSFCLNSQRFLMDSQNLVCDRFLSSKSKTEEPCRYKKL